MLAICTWLWGDKFEIGDAIRLHNMLKRNVKQPYKFILFTNVFEPTNNSGMLLYPIVDLKLLHIKGCFARLRIFDPEFQYKVEIAADQKFDRFITIDLDTVVTKPIDPILDLDADFAIMQGGNAANPCPYNGALQSLRKSAHPEVWQDFSLEKANKVPFYSFPDDQGWLHHKVPNAPGWKTGTQGVYVFRKPGWPDATDNLPQDARLVTFINKTPRMLAKLPWIQEHWR